MFRKIGSHYEVKLVDTGFTCSLAEIFEGGTIAYINVEGPVESQTLKLDSSGVENSHAPVERSKRDG
jgi:hypothetical protein